MIKLHYNQEIRDMVFAYASTLFVNRKSSFKYPLDSLEDLKTIFVTKEEVFVIDYIKKNYHPLLIASPTQLRQFASYSDRKFQNLFYNANKATKFSDAIVEALKYDSVRNKEGIDFFQALGIRTCVYCNSQYALVIEDDLGNLTAKFEFDHFYPKSKYPHLSISILNLLPSCGNCNKAKSDNVYSMDEIFYLYSMRDKDLIAGEFDLTKGGQAKYLASRKVEDIEFNYQSLLKNSGSTKLNNEIFCIQSIYETQKDIIAELYQVHSAYSDAKARGLINDFEDLFPNKRDFKSLLIGTFIGKDGVHKRPLTKFRQDIWSQIKIKN
ncbi:MAG: uncharacterized protein K0S32_2858 [Bacteroidetes bacterium]|jgi:hypothetical protein|nr:uncharacterized protein [Bacteroidota bacterium]